MKRSMCGLVVLAAAAGLWACKGDPTEPLREGEIVRTEPSAVFVDQGGTAFVTVQLLDGQGNQLTADFQAQNIGPGITVTKDTNFLPTTTGSLETRERFIVTGVDALVTSFVVTSGGASDTVAVRVIPAGAGIPPATVASTGPNASDPTVLTVPAGYQFNPDSGVTFDAGAAIVIDRAADGRSITVLPPPGTTTTGTATIFVDFLPTVPLATTTDVPLTISVTVPAQAGTGDPATAPEITIPAPGSTGGFFDGGAFGAATCGGNSGVPCQLYKFTLAADATFNISATWSNEADLGIYFLTADGTTDTDQACDEHGRGADAKPEACEISLAAGTYLVGFVNFGPAYPELDPNPDWIGLTITTPAP
ncbi:MAG: hypothetical protein M3Q37_05590 [Gemmatimonadota bacterium]|nr:hypothetical protein [Gemmatimonadota bacterium]